MSDISEPDQTEDTSQEPETETVTEADENPSTPAQDVVEEVHEVQEENSTAPVEETSSKGYDQEVHDRQQAELAAERDRRAEMLNKSE